MSEIIIAECAVKRCSKCGQEKPITEFAKNRSGKGGLRTYCKACEVARVRVWRDTNPEKARAQNKARYEANREKERVRSKARYEANPEKAREKGKAWYEANPERARARKHAWYGANRERARALNKAWNEANPEKARSLRKAWREANPEKCRANHKVWCEANPEKTRVIAHTRRARKRNAQGAHTVQQIKDLLQKQRSRCAYCKKDIKKKYHVDHIIALVNGGGNGIDNIQLLCPFCNLSKRAADPIEFAQRLGFLL